MTDFPSVIRHDCIKNERRDTGTMDEKEEKEREEGVGKGEPVLFLPHHFPISVNRLFHLIVEIHSNKCDYRQFIGQTLSCSFIVI